MAPIDRPVALLPTLNLAGWLVAQWPSGQPLVVHWRFKLLQPVAADVVVDGAVVVAIVTVACHCHRLIDGMSSWYRRFHFFFSSLLAKYKREFCWRLAFSSTIHSIMSQSELKSYNGRLSASVFSPCALLDLQPLDSWHAEHYGRHRERVYLLPSRTEAAMNRYKNGTCILDTVATTTTTTCCCSASSNNRRPMDVATTRLANNITQI